MAAGKTYDVMINAPRRPARTALFRFTTAS